MDIVEQENKEQAAFERMEDSLGRTRGVRKCKKCKEKLPVSEFDLYGGKKQKHKDYCRSCDAERTGAWGIHRKSQLESKRKNTNWRREYIQSVKDFQELSVLCSSMFRLLVQERPSLNGDGYKVDAITEEYHRLVGD